MAPAHRARGDARARGGRVRARARRAALGGGGRRALQRHTALSNPQQVVTSLWPAWLGPESTYNNAITL